MLQDKQSYKDIKSSNDIKNFRENQSLLNKDIRSFNVEREQQDVKSSRNKRC